MRRAIWILAGGLAAFVAGAAMGATRTWPLRYPIKVVERMAGTARPMPELMAGVRTDPAGRLLSFPGKVEAGCPAQTARMAVILVAGQSNAANSAAQRVETRHPGRVLNVLEGRCWIAGSPLLGATGFAGEVWTAMADRLVDSGAYDHVVIATMAVGGSAAGDWAAAGQFADGLRWSVRRLAEQYRPTHVLWHQGETDYRAGTTAADYGRALVSFAEILRKEGVAAPVFVARATRCSPVWRADNPVRAAQLSLPSLEPGFVAGIDTDSLVPWEDRFDGCHFSGDAQARVSSAWADAILGTAWAARSGR